MVSYKPHCVVCHPLYTLNHWCALIPPATSQRISVFFSKPPKVLQRLGSQIVKPGGRCDNQGMRSQGQVGVGDSFSIDLFFWGEDFKHL